MNGLYHGFGMFVQGNGTLKSLSKHDLNISLFQAAETATKENGKEE